MTQDPGSGKDPVMATGIVNSQPHHLAGFGPNSMNGHITVTGRPQLGKTFLGKLRAIREHGNGRTVLVVDAKGRPPPRSWSS